jgi:hypothetical protein
VYSLLNEVSVQDDSASGLEREGQLWERRLWTTGGKLEFSKCLYYILFSIFEPDGTPRMESVTNMGDDLVSLTSGGQALIPNNIEHRDCSKAHLTLGVWQTPNGFSDTRVSESLSKSIRFSRGAIKKAPMSRLEAVTAFNRLAILLWWKPTKVIVMEQTSRTNMDGTTTRLSFRGRIFSVVLVP